MPAYGYEPQLDIGYRPQNPHLDATMRPPSNGLNAVNYFLYREASIS
jgi:hypothetical protein